MLPTYESSEVSIVSKDLKQGNKKVDLSLSKIENNNRDDDVEDPVVMSEISMDNPIRELRDKLEQSPGETINIKHID